MLLVLAGCASFWPTSDASSPRAAGDVFSCATAQLIAQHYAITQADPKAGTLEARRTDRTTWSPEWRQIDRADAISLSVSPRPEGTGSAIHLRAASYSDLMTKRGPTSYGEPASPAVQQAARAVLAQCAE
jgi:hypothetical protein